MNKNKTERPSLKKFLKELKQTYLKKKKKLQQVTILGFMDIILKQNGNFAIKSANSSRSKKIRQLRSNVNATLITFFKILWNNSLRMCASRLNSEPAFLFGTYENIKKKRPKIIPWFITYCSFVSF